jgi:hypothetical protein
LSSLPVKELEEFPGAFITFEDGISKRSAPYPVLLKKAKKKV